MKTLIFVLTILTLFTLSSCAVPPAIDHPSTGDKISYTWKQIIGMTPRDRVTLAMKIYNDEYQRLTNVDRTNLSPAAKKYYQERLERLRDAWSWIKIYDQYVAQGRVVPQEAEDQIMKFLDYFYFNQAY